jgi:hypothetical protein
VNGGKFLTPAEKDKYDEYYVRNASPWFDLRILIMTLRVLFRFTLHTDHEVAADDRVGFGKTDDGVATSGAKVRATARAHRRNVESPPLASDTPSVVIEMASRKAGSSNRPRNIQ